MKRPTQLNKIHHMDCIDGIKEIPSGSVNLIVTDPPYFLGMTHNGQKGTMTDLAICRPFFETLFKEFNRVLTPDGKVYFFTDWRGYAFYYPILAQPIPVKNLLVWDKVSGAGNNYAFHHELVIFGAKSPVNIGGSNVIRLKGFSGGAKRTNGEKVHPTQKPVEIIEKFILDASKEGDTVLDCFMGSGTTAVACVRTGRNYIGFEIQEKYIEIALDRLRIEKENQKLPFSSVGKPERV